MVRPIITNVDILSQKSEPFEFGKDEHIIDDMIDTAIEHKDKCVGLAAVQIGVHKRVILVWDGIKFKPFINPFIVKHSNKSYVSKEGCLSVEGLRYTKRYNWVTVIYKERNGKTKKETFSGYGAQIIQHEIDHLNGILI